MAILIVSLVAGLGYLWATRRSQPAEFATAPSVQDLQITQLTTSGLAARPALSPDGKYVAYIHLPAPGGLRVPGGSVWIRQVAASSNVQIVASDPAVTVFGLTVTPDGNYVDFLRAVRGAGPPPLWRVPLLGGSAKNLVERVQTPVGWSPDGRRVAFVRVDAGSAVSELLLADADGANPRVLATRTNPAAFDAINLVSAPRVRPAWSPDGRVIAVPGQLQLWQLAYPSGQMTRLTNDLSSYMDLGMSGARDTLVTTKTDRRVAIWVSDGLGANAKEVASAVQSSGTTDSVTWAADRLLFTSTIGGHRTISSVGPDGGPPRRWSLEPMPRPRHPTAGPWCSGRPTVRARASGRRQTAAGPCNSLPGSQAGPA